MSLHVLEYLVLNNTLFRLALSELSVAIVSLPRPTYRDVLSGNQPHFATTENNLMLYWSNTSNAQKQPCGISSALSSYKGPCCHRQKNSCRSRVSDLACIFSSKFKKSPTVSEETARETFFCRNADLELYPCAGAALLIRKKLHGKNECHYPVWPFCPPRFSKHQCTVQYLHQHLDDLCKAGCRYMKQILWAS